MIASQLFPRFHYFRKRVYRKHRCFVFRPSDDKNDCPSEESTVQQDNLYLEPQKSETDPSVSDPQTAKPNLDKLLEDFRDNLFGFILKCREKNHLHLSVQQYITDDVKFLFCFFKENYDSFISYLEKSGFDVSKCPELEQVLHSSDFFDKAYEVVCSPHMKDIKEHCKAKMDYTEPVHYTLRGFSGHKIGTYSYVPISEVLKKYCSHEDVWDLSGKYRSQLKHIHLALLVCYSHRWV